MPIYAVVQRDVELTSGFVSKACWIAHVPELLGKKHRIAPNRINPNVRRYPCPTEKQAAIVEALRKLEDVRPRRSS
ncbi:MAG TPA: hypothetical protein VKD23_14700 [Terriglobales bacterium]|nr:hypothetical protein [Terriglobales bacterium]